METYETSGFFRANRAKYIMLMAAPPPMKMKRGTSWWAQSRIHKSRCSSEKQLGPGVFNYVVPLHHHNVLRIKLAIKQSRCD